MENQTSNIVRGSQYYPRKSTENAIYRYLKSNSHIFLAAPRRAGKSSVMLYLQDNPENGFVFVYVLVQSVESINEFFERIFNEVKELIPSTRGKKVQNHISLSFRKFWKRIKSIGLSNVAFEEKGLDYFSELKDLLKNYRGNLTIGIMIDEVPDAILNIEKKHSTDSSIRLIQLCRDLRQLSSKAVKFIYTGSLSLPVVTRKLKVTHLIADLTTVELTPLTQSEALDFLQRLFENPIHNIPYQKNVLSYILEKVTWLMPLPLQLYFQEIHSAYLLKPTTITKKQVDEATLQLLKANNKQYFEERFQRKETDTFVIELLKQIAEKTYLDLEQIKFLATNQNVLNYQTIIEDLIFEGYIHENLKGEYRFNDALLRLWWLKYIV